MGRSQDVPSAVHTAVRRFFAALASPVRGVLVGLSGGADSAAMLFALADLRQELGIAVHAGCLHHGQRSEADREITRLNMLCDELGVPFHAGRADVPSVARDERVSLEVAGRMCRYRFLFGAASGRGLDAVATAHTLDDQAETVLLRVLTGTGLEGLGGVAPVRTAVPPESPSPLLVIRPILGASRRDTEELCRQRCWSPFHDPCNLDLSYPRNRLRHEILPLLERSLNPNVREALVRLADIAREENRVLETMVEDIVDAGMREPVETPVAALLSMPLGLRRRVARRLLARAGATGKTLGFDTVERLLATAHGGAVDLGSGIRCRSDGERLVLEHRTAGKADEPYQVEVAIPGVTQLPVGTLRAELGEGLQADGPRQAVLDPGLLPAPLLARTRRPGDRIRLAGGTRKLGDLMTDRRMPLAMRDRVPVIGSQTQVVWVPGLAVSREYTARRSGPVLRLIFSEASPAASPP